MEPRAFFVIPDGVGGPGLPVFRTRFFRPTSPVPATCTVNPPAGENRGRASYAALSIRRGKRMRLGVRILR